MYWAVLDCSGLWHLIGWGGHWSGRSGSPGDPGDLGDPGGPGGPGGLDYQSR